MMDHRHVRSSRSSNVRTYGKTGKKSAAVDKATELFDKALKLHPPSPAPNKKPETRFRARSRSISSHQIKRKNALKDDTEIKLKKGKIIRAQMATLESETDHSSFMIFNSSRERSTKNQKGKPRPKKKGRKGQRKKKDTGVKMFQNTPMKSPSGHVLGSASELVVEDEPQRVDAFDMKHHSVELSSTKMLKEKRHQRMAISPLTREGGKKSHRSRCDKSSSSAYSSIETARASDKSQISVYQIPTSPIADLVLDEGPEMSESEDQLSSIVCDPETYWSSMEISGEETDKNDCSSGDISMWVSTYTYSSEKKSSLESFSRSPSVNMRQRAYLNSTAKTAEDDINPKYFPNMLSPIHQQTAELTPYKETDNNNFAPRLSRKKRKTSDTTKEDFIAKCSTKLFNSTTMHNEKEDLPNLSKISSGLHFDVNDNISSTCEKKDKHLPVTKINTSIKKDPDYESKAGNCKYPEQSMSGKGCDYLGVANITKKKRNQRKSINTKQQETLPNVFCHNGQEENFDNFDMLLCKSSPTTGRFSKEYLKTIEQSRKGTKKSINNKSDKTSFTKGLKGEESSSLSKVNFALEDEECRFPVCSSSSIGFPKSILKKRNDVNNHQKQVLPKNNLILTKRIFMKKWTQKDLEQMVKDDSICFINRLFIKSALSNIKNGVFNTLP